MNEVHILISGLRFPEGPTFDEDGCIWCAEQDGGSLFCRDPEGQTMRVHTGGRPCGVVIRDNYLWFGDADQRAIRRMHVKSKSIETVLTHIAGEPLLMPNDLLFDQAGNLLFTCSGPPGQERMGYVAVYSATHQTELIADGLHYPNGLLFHPDNQTLMIAETCRQRIWQGYWDNKGLSWENIHVWATTSDNAVQDDTSGPTGMTTGPDGYLYVALWGESLIRVLSTEGVVVRDIPLPGSNPSHCVFDPTGRLGLVVSEAEQGQLLSIR